MTCLTSVHWAATFGPRTLVNETDGIEKLTSDKMGSVSYPAARLRAMIAASWSFNALKCRRKGSFERCQLRGLPVLERPADRLQCLGDTNQGNLLLLRQLLQARGQGTRRLDVEDERLDLLPGHLVVELRDGRSRRVGALGNRVHELWR